MFPVMKPEITNASLIKGELRGDLKDNRVEDLSDLSVY